MEFEAQEKKKKVKPNKVIFRIWFVLVFFSYSLQTGILGGRKGKMNNDLTWNVKMCGRRNVLVYCSLGGRRDFSFLYVQIYSKNENILVIQACHRSHLFLFFFFFHQKRQYWKLFNEKCKSIYGFHAI